MEWADGTKAWYVNGQQHRENGPAFKDADGTKTWYINGRIHREDGPAIEYANGDVAYYLNGKTRAEIEQQVKENMARIQQKELLDVLFQDQDISDIIKTDSAKLSKKL